MNFKKIKTKFSKILAFLCLASVFLSFLLVISGEAATYFFSPASKEFLLSCRSTVDIVIDASNENSNAADIELYYKPSEINIIDSQPNIPGIQIKPGNAYESYFGNEVDTQTGRIRLAGASFVGNLNSKKTFATIEFTSKENITQTSFEILFDGIGATLDSNIADASTSLDLLTGVTNATYTFVTGPCFADKEPPSIVYQNPKAHAKDVPTNASTNIKITDNQSGVDLESIIFDINNEIYRVSDPEVSYTGEPLNYNFVINPRIPIKTEVENFIKTEAKDLANNKNSRQIVFNIPDIVCPAPDLTGGDNDTDGDGIPNSEDDTPGGIGTIDDLDGDGIPNSEDLDIDEDGIPNFLDYDLDGDGVVNYYDDDIDGDGVVNEEDPDIDGDGVVNEDDPTPRGVGTRDDIDGDGIPNEEDPDIDGDGVVNYYDDDIDGDGVPNSEDLDMDGDGVVNEDDTTPRGFGTSNDLDGDGVVNKEDPDMDGDGIPNEGDPDIDGDGVVNYYDDDIDGDGIVNTIDPDMDGDGVVNEDDPTPRGIGTSNDLDGDGIVNKEDPDMDGDGVVNFFDTSPKGKKNIEPSFVNPSENFGTLEQTGPLDFLITPNLLSSPFWNNLSRFLRSIGFIFLLNLPLLLISLLLWFNRKQILEGKAEEGSKIFDNVEVGLYELGTKEGRKIDSTQSNKAGDYYFFVQPGLYTARATKNGIVYIEELNLIANRNLKYYMWRMYPGIVTMGYLFSIYSLLAGPSIPNLVVFAVYCVLFSYQLYRYSTDKHNRLQPK